MRPHKPSWNVVRSEFDHILLKHASSVGVKVYENTKVISLDFDDNNKPISAAYVCRSSSGAGNVVDGTITFKYLVDATGRAGLMSTKYLKNRTFMESLKNIAVWGYWAGAGSYAEGTTAAGAPWFEALTGANLIPEPGSATWEFSPVPQTNPGGRGSYLCIQALLPLESSSTKKPMLDVRGHSLTRLTWPRRIRFPSGRQRAPCSKP